MASYPQLTEKDFSQAYPELAQQIRENLLVDFVPSFFRVLVSIAPHLALPAWEMLRANLCEGVVPRALKEMIFVVVAKTRGCDYCKIAHYAISCRMGIPGSTLSMLIENINEFRPEATRKILLAAAEMVSGPGFDPAQAHAQMLEAGVQEADVPEIVSMIACANYFVTLALGLLIPPDQEFLDIISSQHALEA